MDYKEAKCSLLIWGLRTAIYESQIPEEPRILSQQRKMGEGFYEKTGKVHAGLYKLFTKYLDWRVNFFCACNWVIEHISFVTRERYIFFVQKKSHSQHYFLLATHQLFSSFISESLAKVQLRQ